MSSAPQRGWTNGRVCSVWREGCRFTVGNAEGQARSRLCSNCSSRASGIRCKMFRMMHKFLHQAQILCLARCLWRARLVM